MTRRLFPALALGILLFALTMGALLSGCWNPFSSDSDDNSKHREPTLSLVPRTCPENVLHDFKSIYAGAHVLVNALLDVAGEDAESG